MARDLKIAWVNVGRRPGAHETALQLCWENKIDVVQVQEPTAYANSRTKGHPGYEMFAPVGPRVRTRSPALRS